MPLHVCATPIGNLEDITLRVLRELAEADIVLCEDTRRTRILLDRHDIGAHLVSFDRRHEARRTAEILPRLAEGARVALVSDAGLPGINDPGARLIAEALERGIPVTVLPGPSAVETALVASGLLAERYLFLGFVPKADAARQRLWAHLRSSRAPAVAFESPRRLPRTLRSLAEADPYRPVAVCRELTKLFEQIVRGSAEELSARITEPPKGEVTLVIGPAPARAGTAEREQAVEALEELVEAGAARRRAAHVIARLTGVPANDLYRETL